jgi:hypothetical protein
MEKKSTKALNVDLNESIEKVFKKYTLEVDDAIEAYGFRATSYIDYAEDTILELENQMKDQVNQHGAQSLFVNLENNLQSTVDDIVDYTVKTAYERNESYNYERKAGELHSVLNDLNTRFISRIECI